MARAFNKHWKDIQRENRIRKRTITHSQQHRLAKGHFHSLKLQKSIASIERASFELFSRKFWRQNEKFWSSERLRTHPAKFEVQICCFSSWRRDWLLSTLWIDIHECYSHHGFFFSRRNFRGFACFDCWFLFQFERFFFGRTVWFDKEPKRL